MFLFSILTLVISILATMLSITTTEEVFKAAMAATAILSMLLTLIFAPWLLKLTLVIIPLMLLDTPRRKINNAKEILAQKSRFIR